MNIFSSGAQTIAKAIGLAPKQDKNAKRPTTQAEVNAAMKKAANQTVKATPADTLKSVAGQALSGITPKAYTPDENIAVDKNPFYERKAMQAMADGYTAKNNAIGQRSAPPMTAAQLGAANTMQAATINQDPQAQFRSQQMGLVDQLGQAAAGQGPSLATLQMQQNTDDAIKTAMAMAASGRGGSAGGRLKGAMDQASMIQQQGARDSAALRVQEQLAARDQLNSVLAQGRGQDIGLATDQAGLMQQAMLANQDATNTFALQQGQLTQGANQANLGATLQQTGMNDAMGQFYDQLGYNVQRDSIGDAQKFAELDLQRLLEMERLKQAGIASSNASTAGMVSGIGQAGATAAPLFFSKKPGD